MVLPIHAIRAFDGEGARAYGGRWNHAGTPLVYTAATRSLALLEILVHVDRRVLPGVFACIPVAFDDSIVDKLASRALPADWQDYPGPVSTRDIGTWWADSLSSAVLQVPSVIVPGEFIFLLNPRHPGFSRMRIRRAEQIVIDTRFRGK